MSNTNISDAACDRTLRRRVAAYGFTAFISAAAIGVAILTPHVALTDGGAESAAPAGGDAAVAADASTAEEHYVACMIGAAGTPDSLERWVDRCRERANLQIVADARYVECMLGAAGTPDSLERWVETCRVRAAEAARAEAQFIRCMLDAPATADALERRVDVCRQRS